MRLALVTDAWLPQVNGVVRTLSYTIREIEAAGHEVRLISPADFRTLPCPTYPEIRLSLFPGRKVRRHARRNWPPTPFTSRRKDRSGLRPAAGACAAAGRSPRRTTPSSRNTFAPARPIPLAAGYAAVRWFHGRAARTLVATPSMQRLLESRGFTNLAPWGRGVDTETLPARATSRSSTCRGRSGCTSVASPSRKASRISWSRLARHEARGRRRARRRATAAPVSASRIRRLPSRRGTGVVRRGIGRLRLSEPHRHVRPGAARGHGLWRSGRSVPGDGPYRCRPPGCHRRAE